MRTLTNLPTTTLLERMSDYKHIIQSTLRQEGRHTRNTKELAKQLPIITKELESRNNGH